MNELTESKLTQDLAYIDSIIDVDEIIAHLDKVHLLETFLKKKHIYKENAAKYAILHAHTILKIIDLNGIEKLEGKERKCAEWLCGLSETERQEYVSRCSEGITIECIWKNEIDAPRRTEAKIQANIKKAQTIVKKTVEEAKTNGYVQTEQSIKQIKELIPDNEDLVRDITMGMRNKLLRSGALGVGDNTGIYVHPVQRVSHDDDWQAHERWSNVRMAIQNRFRSISHDIENLCTIIQTCGIEMSYLDFMSDYNISHEKIDFFELSILLMLGDMGFIDGASLESKLNSSFEYKSAPWHLTETDGYKTGREYFMGTLSAREKRRIAREYEERKRKGEDDLHREDIPPETQEQIHKKVREKCIEAREKSGLTQKELAQKMGISSDYISMVERGAKNASYDYLSRVEKAATV